MCVRVHAVVPGSLALFIFVVASLVQERRVFCESERDQHVASGANLPLTRVGRGSGGSIRHVDSFRKRAVSSIWVLYRCWPLPQPCNVDYARDE